MSELEAVAEQVAPATGMALSVVGRVTVPALTPRLFADYRHDAG